MLHDVHRMDYLPNLPSQEPWLHDIYYILIDLYFPIDLKSKNLHYINFLKARTHTELINHIFSQKVDYTSKAEH